MFRPPGGSRRRRRDRGVCRICRNDSVRRKVNELLATGASDAIVLRALWEDNAELDKCDRVTVDSIRNHCGRHFPVQNVAKANYREILERGLARTKSASSKASPLRSLGWRSTRS